VRYHRQRDLGILWPYKGVRTDRPDTWELVEIDDDAIKPARTLEQVVRESGGFHWSDMGIHVVASAIREAFPEAGL
jgi:hypothetical protein